MAKRVTMGVLGAAILIAVYLGFSMGRAHEDATIAIDTTQRFQTMMGWEVTARLWEEDKPADRFDWSWLASRTVLMDKLINDFGINRVRIELRSGSENPIDYWREFSSGNIGYQAFRQHRYEKINDNDDPNVANPAGFQFAALDYQVEKIVAAMRERLAARGKRLFVNLCYVDFTTGGQGNVSFADNPAEYAELIVAAFLHLRDKYHFTPDALEVILEPENTAYWRGRQIGEAIVETDSRLGAEGFAPRIIAPSTTRADAAPGYIDDMMAVPGIAGRVNTFSYHAYDDPSDTVRAKIFQRAKKYGVETAMLEHERAGAKELVRDLTVAHASAWQQYGIAHRDSAEAREAGDYGYLMFVDPDLPVAQRIRISAGTPGLVQYFRNIDAGAVRVAATTDNSRKEPVAFLNPDGRLAVVVRGVDAGKVKITGVQAGRYTIAFAPDAGNISLVTEMAAEPDLSLTVQIPGPGVMSISQRVSR